MGAKRVNPQVAADLKDPTETPMLNLANGLNPATQPQVHGILDPIALCTAGVSTLTK